jgi:FdhE protein
MATDTSLQDLKRQHPEWEPWLAVVQEVLKEIADPKWDAVLPPGLPRQNGKTPLLSGATLPLEQSLISSMMEQLMRIASRSGTPELKTLKAAAGARPDVHSVFRAFLNQDGHQIKEIASAAGANSEAFQAVAALLPMPFLHACNRRWGSAQSESWLEGYCPVCGAWPAFAEVRGIERTRYFRCGRCGAGWQVHALFCPYCGITDHNELVSLVPEQGSSKWLIDACNRCLGYVKGFSTLQGSPPIGVMLDDLASIELDVAAAERGYKRPQGAGYSLNVKVGQNGAMHLS